jgi:hypothetical protein
MSELSALPVISLVRSRRKSYSYKQDASRSKPEPFGTALRKSLPDYANALFRKDKLNFGVNITSKQHNIGDEYDQTAVTRTIRNIPKLDLLQRNSDQDLEPITLDTDITSEVTTVRASTARRRTSLKSSRTTSRVQIDLTLPTVSEESEEQNQSTTSPKNSSDASDNFLFTLYDNCITLKPLEDDDCVEIGVPFTSRKQLEAPMLLTIEEPTPVFKEEIEINMENVFLDDLQNLSPTYRTRALSPLDFNFGNDTVSHISSSRSPSPTLQVHSGAASEWANALNHFSLESNSAKRLAPIQSKRSRKIKREKSMSMDITSSEDLKQIQKIYKEAEKTESGKKEPTRTRRGSLNKDETPKISKSRSAEKITKPLSIDMAALAKPPRPARKSKKIELAPINGKEKPLIDSAFIVLEEKEAIVAGSAFDDEPVAGTNIDTPEDEPISPLHIAAYTIQSAYRAYRARRNGVNADTTPIEAKPFPRRYKPAVSPNTLMQSRDVVDIGPHRVASKRRRRTDLHEMYDIRMLDGNELKNAVLKLRVINMFNKTRNL